MYFVSTRGGAKVTSAEAVLRGMAEGGGLFVPEIFPQITAEEMNAMLGMDYPERAALILGKYFDEYPQEELLKALKAAYESFEEKDSVPLVKVEEGLYILELFHGPSCSHKDIGMTLLPYLLRKGREITGTKGTVLLLTATTGDAGKAAMEAFKDEKDVKVAVFYPEEGVSKMQKIALCTQDGDNLNAVAVRGNFDECQSAVKKILRSKDVREKFKEKEVTLSSASSINIGELLPQVVCYFSAYLDLVSSDQLEMGAPADFSLPAGNFGGVLAAYYAKRMGLPIGTLVCAANRNNAIADFMAKGVIDKKKPFYRTMSPALDIQLASNLERLLFELTKRDVPLTVERMKSLATTGRYSLRAEEMKLIRETFFGGYASEEDTVESVYEFFEEFNYPLDTHTGIAVHVARIYARKREEDINAQPRPMVIVATTSPYKYPQTIYYALTGNDVKDSFKGVKRIHLITAMKVPEALKALRYKPLRFKTTVSSDKILDEVSDFIG